MRPPSTTARQATRLRPPRIRPCRRRPPTAHWPLCKKKIFPRSLVNARITLVQLSYERSHVNSYVCNPFDRPAPAKCARPRPTARQAPRLRPPRVRPCRRRPPAAHWPLCKKNIFPRSLVNARITLVQRSYERSHVNSYLCNPFRFNRPAAAKCARPALDTSPTGPAPPSAPHTPQACRRRPPAAHWPLCKKKSAAGFSSDLS